MMVWTTSSFQHHNFPIIWMEMWSCLSYVILQFWCDRGMYMCWLLKKTLANQAGAKNGRRISLQGFCNVFSAARVEVPPPVSVNPARASIQGAYGRCVEHIGGSWWGKEISTAFIAWKPLSYREEMYRRKHWHGFVASEAWLLGIYTGLPLLYPRSFTITNHAKEVTKPTVTLSSKSVLFKAFGSHRLWKNYKK